MPIVIGIELIGELNMLMDKGHNDERELENENTYPAFYKCDCCEGKGVHENDEECNECNGMGEIANV